MVRVIKNKTIFKASGMAVLAAIFCTGCGDDGDNGVQPSKVSTFVDVRDGRTYKKVQIGEQIWMAENLKYAADNSICHYGYSHGLPLIDSLKSCEDYGRLYDWNTAMDNEPTSDANPSGVEGVCPVGWHLPSDAEWTELTDFIGENVATRLKSRDFHGDSDYHTRDGIDMYGFGALPTGAGSHDYNAGTTSFIHFGWNAYWWSSTEYIDSDRAYARELMQSNDWVLSPYMDKHVYFLSVRCVHD